jgi:hypothetical protein
MRRRLRGIARKLLRASEAERGLAEQGDQAGILRRQAPHGHRGLMRPGQPDLDQQGEGGEDRAGVAQRSDATEAAETAHPADRVRSAAPWCLPCPPIPHKGETIIAPHLHDPSIVARPSACDGVPQRRGMQGNAPPERQSGFRSYGSIPGAGDKVRALFGREQQGACRSCARGRRGRIRYAQPPCLCGIRQPCSQGEGALRQQRWQKPKRKGPPILTLRCGPVVRRAGIRTVSPSPHRDLRTRWCAALSIAGSDQDRHLMIAFASPHAPRHRHRRRPSAGHHPTRQPSS